VKQLVELHGGQVHARSEGPGSGSTFTVDLPLVSAPAKTGAVRVAPGRVGPLRILVTDDNEETAFSLSMLLRRMGHQVRACNNGPDAIVEAGRFHPQVIFMDIGMPGMDGYETCRAIRAGSNGTRPFIIALTGWGQDEDKRLASDAGFDLHVTKPMDRGRLLECLEKSVRADLSARRSA
jgi:CheY-like chemotaxis protein